MNFDFIFSNRFWALVIGSLAIASQGGFTTQAWANGVIALVSGFAAVRTIDRFGEKVGNQPPTTPPTPAVPAVPTPDTQAKIDAILAQIKTLQQ